MTFAELITTAPPIIQGKMSQLWFLNERPDFHPEPSAMHHIAIVTERLIAKNYSIDLILAGVLHDICKYDCVQINKQTGYPTSPNHGLYSSQLISSSEPIQHYIESYGGNVARVAEICQYHMAIQRYEFMKTKKKETIEALDTFQDLLLFTKCDDMLSDEYKLADVLPHRISADPSEGGTYYRTKFLIGDGAAHDISLYEYNYYLSLGIYKEIADGQDFSIKEMDLVSTYAQFSAASKLAH